MSKIELVSMEERRWIAENATISVGSKEGRGVTYKIIDLEKVIEKIRKERSRHSLSPYVEIQPISADAHKAPSRTATFQKDPITGVLYGIVIGQDDFGNPRWQKIQWSDHMSLNLDNENEAKIWAVIRFHPSIQGSPWEEDTPYYKIYDPVDDARMEIRRAEEMQKAFKRIDILLEKPRDMVLFTRYIGEVSGEELKDNANYDIVRGVLLRFANSYPIEFNRRWDNKERSFAERFYTAKALGILSNDADRGYTYRNIPLGLSDEEVIKTLSSDNNLMMSINEQIEEKDKVTKAVINTYEEKRGGKAPDEGELE